MQNSLKNSDDFIFIKIHEENISASTIFKRFNEELSYRGEGSWSVALDVEDIDILYSNNISDVVKIKKHIMNHGGELYLINVNTKLERFFTANNLHKILKIFCSEAAFVDEIENEHLNEGFSSHLMSTFSLEVTDTSFRINIKGSLVGTVQEAELKSLIDDALSHNSRLIEINLSSTIFIDSTAANSLIKLKRECNKNDLKLGLINPNDVIKDLFNLLGQQQMLH